MNLTQIPDLFTSVHEDGIDDLIEAFFQSQTRYLRYGTPIFAPYSTSAITSIPSINFPGIPDDIQFAIALRQPFVDLHHSKRDSNTELPSRVGQFVISAEVILVVLADSGKQEFDVAGVNTDPAGSTAVSELTELEIQARGSIYSDGSSITFKVRDIEIDDICPQSLENGFERMMQTILDVMLKKIRVPIPSQDQYHQVTKEVWGHLLQFRLPDFMQNRHI